MMHIDVILPLPLDTLFTYSVPEDMATRVQPLVRVQVPFGLTKTQTALVVSVRPDAQGHKTAEGYDIKDIISVLDERPVLLPSQYKLWQWISHYYMSPLGDILKAALPQGMKKEDGYRPRLETYVRLPFALPRQPLDEAGRNELATVERSLHNQLDMLVRSPKQLQTFNTYLEISHWDELSAASGTLPAIKEVTREELINAARSNTTTVKALVTKGCLKLYDKPVGRLNTDEPPHPENIKPLSEEQQKAVALIHNSECRIHNSPGDGKSGGLGNSMQGVKPVPVLLHGVTSSGKTEVYIHLIQEAIDRGEQVLYLLPEIALTVQITQRLQHVFGSRMGIYHSKYSDAERVEIWQKQLSDQPYDIILGARSAVFLPYQRLGLVIIDEEHETSFKQQDPAPRYHARSVAMMMAHWCGAQVVLGTATPSIESYRNVELGKYRLVTMTQRYKNLQLPTINVVDTKDLRRRKMMRGMLSPILKNAIGEALERGEQVILFQNRRGFSPVIECHQCGWSPKCPNCDVSLTYHKTMSALTCHYCGYTYRMPEECPDCGNRDLRDRGAGTEKVEDAIADEFPQARIARMDLDTTHTRNAYERIIAEFASGKTNLLIGTQMVTKGLDFDRVSVVGILSADTMLNQPDFRAYEHAFTMMTQVAGRAGRKGRQGQVILQTNNPGLPVISQVVHNDYQALYRTIKAERQEFNYPPFSRLIYVYLRHKDEKVVDSAALELGSRLRQSLGSCVWGPDKPAVARIKALCIRKIMLKLPLTYSISATRQVIKQAVAATMQDQRYKSLLIHYDVDPQ